MWQVVLIGRVPCLEAKLAIDARGAVFWGLPLGPRRYCLPGHLQSARLTSASALYAGRLAVHQTAASWLGAKSPCPDFPRNAMANSSRWLRLLYVGRHYFARLGGRLKGLWRTAPSVVTPCGRYRDVR